MPEGEGIREGILRGHLQIRAGRRTVRAVAQLFGSGSILNEALRAQQILAERYQVATDVWSVTSYNELRREGAGGGALEPPASRVGAADAVHREGARRLARARSSRRRDYMKAVPDQLAPWLGGRLTFARHRRLRAQRKSRASAPVLRDFRGSDRAGDARRRWRAPARSTQASRSRDRGAGFPSGEAGPVESVKPRSATLFVSIRVHRGLRTMLFITENQVRELLTMREAVRLMRETFAATAAGTAQNQPRRRMILAHRDGRCTAWRAPGESISARKSTPPIPSTARISSSCCSTPKPRGRWRRWRRIIWARSAPEPPAVMPPICWPRPAAVDARDHRQRVSGPHPA